MKQMSFSVRLFCLLLALVFSNCQSGSSRISNSTAEQAGNLTVSAAASLKDAFTEIGESFKSKTGKTVSFNFAASGALQQQIESGAPVDVFASAGAKQMDELAAKNLIDTATRRDFARNSLVLIAPVNSKLEIKTFDDLTKPDVQKIAVGNSKTVPAGQYAEETLTKMNLQTAVQSKLIMAENVRQVLDYVARGETDAGIVYATDALTMKDNVRVVATAEETSHAPILYPAALIKDSKQAQTARDFIEFVAGAEGQSILRKYGFASGSEK